MPWQNWIPQERATLCFVLKEGRLLLIRKKRGLGAGKMNAPGGRIEPGETETECTIREAREEVGVTPIEPEKRGELYFQFLDGYSLHCSVFIAFDCEGEPVETDEATPQWTPLDAIPFGEMWEDDRHWLPLLLEGKTFCGYFHFDGEEMKSIEIETMVEFLDHGRPAR